MDSILLWVLAVLVFVLVCAVVYLIALQMRKPVQDVQTAVLAEKLSRLEPVSQAVNNLQIGLAELQSYTKARQELERQTAQSIKRLEAVIAGTQSKGTAGENILETVFAKLPPDWQVRDFKVGNRVVEFGLRLPNNLILPIDSKWPATGLLERFTACEDPDEQRKLKMAVETTVLEKAKEVRKYIDPNFTVNFGIAAVPDAVYDLCSGIQCEVFQLNVVLISYSMFVPYLLLVFQMMLKSSQSIDIRKLDACVEGIRSGMDALQEELEGRLARAITMLSNSRNDMAVQLSKMSSNLTGLQLGAERSLEISDEEGNKLVSPASNCLEHI